MLPSGGPQFSKFACIDLKLNKYALFANFKGQLVPREKIHPQLFKGSDMKFSKPKAHKIAIDRHNNHNVKNKDTHTLKRFKKRNKSRMEKLKALGVDYELTCVVSFW